MTSFDFREFLSLAEELGVRADEAALRSAVSRAYYGLLHLAYRALPEHHRAAIGPGAIHRMTWDLDTTSSMRTSRQIGHAGIRLRRFRIACDYRNTPMIAADDVSGMLVDARQVLELLDRHGFRP